MEVLVPGWGYPRQIEAIETEFKQGCGNQQTRHLPYLSPMISHDLEALPSLQDSSSQEEG
jgi:hypothetical protein